MRKHLVRSAVFVGVCALIVVAGLLVHRALPDLPRLASGLSWPGLVATMAAVMGASGVLTFATHLWLARQRRPAVEGAMLGRLYWLVGVLAVVGSVAYGFGVLKTFTTAFSLFGGMLLGWSLQAPVSGFAAWVLISLKRPYRPGDRVQFPNLGLVGDIKEIGPMYTVLDQVGGSVQSEEAVGRYILVPNAMLFSQVVINYTVSQDAAYMLDEVVVRITYDSDWRAAEKVLLDAAQAVTRDVIEATGEQPYIRADYYDYGVYLRLRYQTRVKDRVETSYEINKLIFEQIQKTPSVDLAIPYVYSYRAGQDRKAEENQDERRAAKSIQIDVALIDSGQRALDPSDVEMLARSIQAEGLLQPVVVVPRAGTDRFDILAGHLRLEACKRLGWKTVPAIVRPADTLPPAGAAGPIGPVGPAGPAVPPAPVPVTVPDPPGGKTP